MSQLLVDPISAEETETRVQDPPTRRRLRIGIWGHYGGANQGDELTVATLIANIRSRLPDAEIVGFCMNPADTRQRHGIEAFPLRAAAIGGRPEKPWSPADAERKRAAMREGPQSSGLRAVLKRSSGLVSAVRWMRKKRRKALSIVRELSTIPGCYRDLKGTDALIVAGSGSLIDDWGGPWEQPYSMYKWSRLARFCGARFVLLSTGAGPIRGRLSRAFLKRAARSTWYRSYRDPGSARLIEGLGVPGEHPIVPDMGFGLDLSRYVRDWSVPEIARSRRIVGLGVMAHCDPRYIPLNDLPRYRAYVKKMAELTAWLLKSDHAVLLVPTDIRFDPQAFADVRRLLRRDHGIADDPRLIEQTIDGLPALASRIAACDYVIHARYHGVVLPCLLGKPVIGVAYNRKHFDLMELMGQRDYCLDIDQLEVPELVERFRALERNRDAIRAELAQRVAWCQTRLSEQYDDLLSGLG